MNLTNKIVKNSMPLCNTIIEIGGEEKKISIYNVDIEAPLYNMNNFE